MSGFQEIFINFYDNVLVRNLQPIHKLHTDFLVLWDYLKTSFSKRHWHIYFHLGFYLKPPAMQFVFGRLKKSFVCNDWDIPLRGV